MSTSPGLTRTEKTVVASCPTPLALQRWLRTLPYNWRNDTLWTFRNVVRHRSANCIEAALAGAAIMELHGEPPLLLDLASEDRLDHVLFLFRRRGRWGSVGKSRDAGLHGRKPVFRTIRDLVFSYVDPYVDGSGRITGYCVADLGSFSRVDWRLSEKNAWAIERWLIRMPHEHLSTSDRRHERMLARFRAHAERHPGRKFTDYAGRNTWL